MRGFSSAASSDAAAAVQAAGGQAASQDVSELLRFIACPLTKAPLRYEAAAGRLVCDELGVAYPVVRGVPQLVPLMGTLMQEHEAGAGAGTGAGGAR